MNTELSKGQRILFLLSVMLTNIVIMGDNVLFPISVNLYEAFPESVSAINFVISGPPVLIVFASLFVPVLLKKFSKKAVLVTGAAMFTFGSVFGIALEVIPWLIVTRCLVGVGQGFVTVAAVALIADVYFEEDIRAKYVGYFNAAQNLVGFALSYFAGIFAVSAGWQNTFKVYWCAIPMLVMCILFVPKIKSNEPLVAESAVKADAPAVKKSMGAEFWCIIISFTVLTMCAMTIAFFLSMFVAENELGDATVSANAISMGSIISFLMGLVFGKIYGKLKRFTLVVGYAALAVAFFLMFTIQSTAICYVAEVFCCIGFVASFTYSFAHCANIVPPEKTDLAVSIVSAAYGIGTFLCTYFVTGLMGVFGTELLTPVLIVPCIVCVVIAVFALFLAVKFKDR